MSRLAVVLTPVAALSTILFIISSASCQEFPPGLRLIAVGGDYGSTNIANVDVITISNNAHTVAAPLPTNLSDFGSTVVNNTIYVVGKDPSTSFRNNFFAYDVTANIWTTLPNFPFNISQNAAVAVGNAIYSIGGYVQNQGFMKHTYKYDLGEQVWSKLPALLPVITWSPCAVADSNNIYYLNLYGGDLYRTSDGANTWTKLSSMISSHNLGSCALLPQSGQILVAGGSPYYTTSSTELYDIATDTWKNAAPMNRKRRMAGATVVPGSHDDVIICGGENDYVDQFNDCELYSATKNQWNVLNITLSVPRHAYGLFVTQV